MIRQTLLALAALGAGCAFTEGEKPEPQALAPAGDAMPQESLPPQQPPAPDFRPSEAYYREGVFEIRVPPGGEREFLVSIRRGETIVFRWDISRGDAAGLSAEFLGLSEAEADRSYQPNPRGLENGSGTLTAPFSGRHGWALSNDGNREVVVLLRVAGFFEEIE